MGWPICSISTAAPGSSRTTPWRSCRAALARGSFTAPPAIRRAAAPSSASTAPPPSASCAPWTAPSRSIRTVRRSPCGCDTFCASTTTPRTRPWTATRHNNAGSRDAPCASPKITPTCIAASWCAPCTRYRPTTSSKPTGGSGKRRAAPPASRSRWHATCSTTACGSCTTGAWSNWRCSTRTPTPPNPAAAARRRGARHRRQHPLRP